MFAPLRHLSHMSCCVLVMLATGVELVEADPPAWSPAESPPRIFYQTVEELRSFYKLADAPRAARKGAYAMVHEDATVELGPGVRELRINGVNITLGRPLMRDSAGKLLISRDDWVYWIDPILRPTYIANRTKLDTVVIDASHGGHDTGTICAASRESQVVLQVAQALQKELETAGLRCLLTRTGDYFLSDRQRVELANAVPGAIFVSLHLNSSNADVSGPSVYTITPFPVDAASPRPSSAFCCKSSALAYALQYTLSSETHLPGNGCRHAQYSLLSSLTMPAVSVELGYASNPKEAAALTSPDYQTRLAAALARGILNYSRAAAPEAKIPVATAPPQKVKSQPRKEPVKSSADRQKKRDKDRSGRKNRPRR